MRNLLHDLRHAIRQMRRSPGFTIVVVLTLALGVGANTTVFSIVDAVMLRPLPYAQPERLMQVSPVRNGGESEFDAVSYPDFFDWRTRNRSFEHLVSEHDASFTLTGVTRAVHLDGQAVSWDLLPMLGVRPELGRGFTQSEEKRGTRVLLISHALWQAQFGADPSIVGRTLHLNGDPYTVIGVMAPVFRFPMNKPKNSFWTTLAIDDDPNDSKPMTANRGAHWLNVTGRLKPGVTVAQADQEMKAIAAQLAAQYPDSNTQENSAKVEPELVALLGDTRRLLMVVLGAVALVLLIACGNIANLLLARVRERQREMAIRASLGAGRAGIVRQLLSESLVLSLTGGLAGCGLAYLATPLVLSLIGTSVPRAADAGVDLRVLGFGLLVSLLSGLIFGLAPAFVALRSDLVSTLQQGGRSNASTRDWLRSTVIVGQVALGIVLTAGAGLLVTSFLKLMHTDEGFNSDHLLTFTFETPDSHYKKTRAQFYRQFFERLRALPGVQSAGGSIILPMTANDITISFENPEKPVAEALRPSANLTGITPGYFRTLQVPLIAGRNLAESDDMQAPQVMLINQAFAQKYFPGEDPLGKKLKPGAGNGTPGGPPWRQIVGVVGNVRRAATLREMEPTMYLPASQLPNWCCLYSVVRASPSMDPASLEPAVRQLVTSIDPEIPVTEVATMPNLLALQLAQPRFAMILLGAFAGLALMLTVVGLYGVMAYSVLRRTREIGLRLALGAQRAAVFKMVLGHAVFLLAVGIGIGLAVVMASSAILEKMLYGTDSRNPLVLTAVIAGMALAGMFAAYLPAYRAAAIEPMEALRTE